MSVSRVQHLGALLGKVPVDVPQITGLPFQNMAVGRSQMMRSAPRLGVGNLECIPLFRDLSPTQLADLHRSMEVCAFRTGDCFVQQGRQNETVFFVLEGSVKICRMAPPASPMSRELILRIAGPGEMVSEEHLICPSGQVANAVPLEPVVCLAWGARDFDALAQAWPALKESLACLLSRRQHQSAARLEVVALHNVAGALAAQLLLFAEEHGQPQANGAVLLPLPLTQSVWAGLTGHSRESVNRTLKRFQANGWIEPQSRWRLSLLNCEALRRTHLSALPR